MQFIGLKDKNGKENYEGDIVKFNYIPAYWRTLMPISEKIGYLLWDNDFLAFCIKSGNEKYFMIPQERLEDIEIIGNLHQNPELLIKGE